MKRILFLFAVSIIIIISPAQQVDSYVIEGRNIFPLDENGKITYSEVVNADSITSDELFVRAHTWFANSFKSANNVIQLNDKEAGRLIGKGNLDAGIPKSNSGIIKSGILVFVYFTVDIQVKEGKYKYTFTDLYCTSAAYGTTYDLMASRVVKNAVWQKSLDKDWMEVKIDVNEKMKNIIESLKKVMSESTDSW